MKSFTVVSQQSRTANSKMMNSSSCVIKTGILLVRGLFPSQSPVIAVNCLLPYTIWELAIIHPFSEEIAVLAENCQNDFPSVAYSSISHV